MATAFAFLFISFMVGIIADPLLRRSSVYGWLSTRYVFAEPRMYERLGVLWFRRFLLATPLRFINQSIHLTTSRDLAVLKEVRERMASAEVSHWVAFASMLAVTPFAWWVFGSMAGLSLVVVNALGNLYPSLLQQYNKRRLAELIAMVEARDASRRKRSS